MISIENKQKIIDLFNNCIIYIYPEQKAILYNNNNKRIGTYYLKTENFYYSGSIFYTFFDNERDNDQNNESLRPIIEEIIKRKISVII